MTTNNLTFEEQLERFNFQPGEHIAIGVEPVGGRYSETVVDVADAAAMVHRLSDEKCNVWLSLNPTNMPVGSTSRGKDEDGNFTRLNALTADLDVKTGGCPSYEVAEQIIRDLSAILRVRPTVITYTGHGIQPTWPVEDCDAANGRKLLARWGRLVNRIAKSRKCGVDNVFQMSRMVRTADTWNVKSEPHIRTYAVEGGGAPLTVAEIEEAFFAHNVYEMPGDGETVAAEPVMPVSDWAYAAAPCGLALHLLTEWPTEPINARHPTLYNRMHRVNALWRHGCLDEAAHRALIAVVEKAHTDACARPGDTRRVGKEEFSEGWETALERVERKTDEQIQAELVGRGGTPHIHLDQMAGSGMNDQQANTGSAQHDTGAARGDNQQDTGAKPDPFEILVGAALTRLRADREARRRLDQESQPALSLPPVKSLDTLLAEPDCDTPYLIDRIAPAGGRVLLSAQYKAGKTTLVGNVVRSLADKDPFLGHFAVHEAKNRIVIIDDELSENTIRLWMRNQGITNTSAVADVVALRGKVGTFNLLDDRCRDAWAKRLRDNGCDYLALDCLRPILDALGLDENHDAGQFLVAFDALLDEAKIPDAFLVQHMGHANERARGDSRLQDWPDAIWRLVRENDEPGSARFFSAYGRDVDVAEGRLGFEPDTRRLTYAAGSRSDAKTEAALKTVTNILGAHAKEGGTGLSGREIWSAVDGEHPRNNVRAALALAVRIGVVEVKPGPRSANLHSVVNPCSACGRPMAVGQGDRHRSCDSWDEGMR